MTPRKIPEAEILGREAGALQLAGDLSPYPDGSLDAALWQTARLEEIMRRFPPARVAEEIAALQRAAMCVTAVDLERTFRNRPPWRHRAK